MLRPFKRALKIGDVWADPDIGSHAFRNYYTRNSWTRRIDSTSLQRLRREGKKGTMAALNLKSALKTSRMSYLMITAELMRFEPNICNKNLLFSSPTR